MIKQAELLRQQLDLLHPLKFKVHIFKTKTASGLRVILLGGSLSPPDQRLLHWRLTSLIPPLKQACRNPGAHSGYPSGLSSILTPLRTAFGSVMRDPNHA